jgi:hypothetical protein
VALLPWAARRVLVERCATMALPSHCGDCGVLLMGGATQHKPSCSIRRMIEEVMEGNKQC